MRLPGTSYRRALWRGRAGQICGDCGHRCRGERRRRSRVLPRSFREALIVWLALATSLGLFLRKFLVRDSFSTGCQAGLATKRRDHLLSKELIRYISCELRYELRICKLLCTRGSRDVGSFLRGGFAFVAIVSWYVLDGFVYFFTGRTHLASSISGTRFVKLHLIVHQQEAHGAPSLCQVCPLFRRQFCNYNLQTNMSCCLI